MSNPFLTKKDPLLEAVQVAMQDGAIRRQAEALVNEEFGVYSRKAVVREDLAAYDARLEEAYKCMKEGKKLAKKDYDKDGKIESPKDEVWGSRFRAAKMAGKMKEEKGDRLVPQSMNNPTGPDKTGASERGRGISIVPQGDSTRQATLPPSPKFTNRVEPEGRKNEYAPGGTMYEEEQIDELYGKGKLPDIRRKHSDDYQTHKARANFHHGEADKADEKDDDEKFERHYGKAVGHERSAEKSAAKRGRASALMDRAKASSDLKAAKNKAKEYRKLAKEETQIDEISKGLALRAMKKSEKRGDDEYDRDEAVDRLSHPDTHWDRAKRIRGHMKRKFGNPSHKKDGTDLLSSKSYEKGGLERRRADTLVKGPRAGKISARHKDKLKGNIKYSLGKHKKPNLPEGYELDEAAYSAKAARAGKDIGKPGKMFSKIAAKAGEKYGSEERGKKVAGAILKRIRAKHMKEGMADIEAPKGRSMADVEKARQGHSGEYNFNTDTKSTFERMRGLSSTDKK